MEEGENEVVVMLDRLDNMLEQSDKCRGDDPVVQKRLLEQHRLIRELGMKFKFSVYKGIVMEARNANLLNENEALKAVVNEEKEKALQIQKKLKHLEDSAATFAKIKEEYEELTFNLKEGVLSLQQIHDPEKPDTREKGTTCFDLFNTSDKDTQTWVPSGCAKCLCEEQQRLELEARMGPTVMLTQADLSRLDEDMTALKNSLKLRDKSWQKMERRDKSQRARLCRLDCELVSMREMANNRKQEIENKTIMIKTLEAQLKKEQREVANLKKGIVGRSRYKNTSKKRQCNEKLSSPPQSQEIVAFSVSEEDDETPPEAPAELPKPPTPPTPPKSKSKPRPATPRARPTPALTSAPTSAPTPRVATMAVPSPKQVNVGSSRCVPSHVLTSESRLRPPSLGRTRENLARAPSNDRAQRPMRNRSILTRTRRADSSPPHSVSMNLKELRV